MVPFNAEDPSIEEEGKAEGSKEEEEEEEDSSI